MPYMTPLQRATESSRMPKSVIKTTVGGGCTAGGCSRRGVVARSSRTNHKQTIRIDFAAGVGVILIKSNSPKRLHSGARGVPARLVPSTSLRTGSRDVVTPPLESSRALVYCAIVPLPASIIGAAINQYRRKPAMSNVIPEKYVDLFQKPAFASLGTLMPDGRPQVTPVWCDFDGQHVIFNSARGRQKDRNVRRDPRVALAIVDPDNPYRYLEIRGTVVEITEDGADQNIDKLAKKYLGVDKYPYAKPGEVRVMYKIRPEHTTVMG